MSESATILVADGSAAKRELLASALARSGYAVIEARTGAEALACVDAESVDLVLLDVKLPDQSGFEVCERIKEHPRHAALPVVHVSEFPVDSADRSSGADAYLTEPIDPDDLIVTVQSVLRYYRARQQAEGLAERLGRLADTTLAINLAPSVARLVEAAAAGAAKIFDGPVVATAETAQGDLLAAATNGRDAPTTVHLRKADNRPAAVGTTIRVDEPAAWPFVAWPAGDTVTVAVARLRADQPPVCVAVPTRTQMPGYPVLRQLAQAVAAATAAQRSFDDEHRIALTLQRSLLQRSLPDVAGWDVAVRYEPASADTEVGGDFYELTVIDGQLLVAIGDVAGHSLHAATVMAEVRHAVRAYAVDGHPPAAVLARVDTLLRRLLPGELATLCLLLIDPRNGKVRMASAGHPPPLVAARRGIGYKEHIAPLLGVAADRPDDLRFTLPRGGTLILYTDGLIERRDADIDAGLAALSRAAARVDADLDRFCERLVRELAPPAALDDIAVVAVRRN
ncbi:fused response regulator/phosphatase [Phytohabitans aurantiacus]|uniref:fused response regulator/phosphatase n=1 Tax=Phytohabitans aurantiacus TaxID=3016789 RepID=UPI00249348A8|nr:fused response regulator/phosphatase [Phytohabitans aurantiacus]